MITLPTLFRASLLATTIAFAGCSMMPMTSGESRYGATLSGAAEVPVNNSPGTGSVEATLDKSTRELRWRFNYAGLSGPATAAHFHGPAAAGTNAGVAVPVPNVASPGEGQATLTPEQAADLLAGKWYFNVHTAANPGGELRGQMTAR